MAQVELQGADFLLPENFGLPGDSLALPAAPAQEPAKVQVASVYNIQANCSTEVQYLPCKVHTCLTNAAHHWQIPWHSQELVLQPAVQRTLGRNTVLVE